MTVFDGLRVLVVEDELLQRLTLSDMIGDLGGALAGGAASVASALELVGGTDCDLAVLDVNLEGERIDPVARALAQRGVPMVFATGYGEGGIAPEFRGWPAMSKPYTQDHLLRAAAAALARRPAA
jgi:CheY-like chemotaxis protein